MNFNFVIAVLVVINLGEVWQNMRKIVAILLIVMVAFSVPVSAEFTKSIGYTPVVGGTKGQERMEDFQSKSTFLLGERIVHLRYLRTYFKNAEDYGQDRWQSNLFLSLSYDKKIPPIEELNPQLVIVIDGVERTTYRGLYSLTPLSEELITLNLFYIARKNQFKGMTEESKVELRIEFTSHDPILIPLEPMVVKELYAVEHGDFGSSRWSEKKYPVDNKKIRGLSNGDPIWQKNKIKA